MSGERKEHDAIAKKVAKAHSLIGEVAFFYDVPNSPTWQKIAEKAYQIQMDLRALYNEILKFK